METRLNTDHRRVIFLLMPHCFPLGSGCPFSSLDLSFYVPITAIIGDKVQVLQRVWPDFLVVSEKILHKIKDTRVPCSPCRLPKTHFPPEAAHTFRDIEELVLVTLSTQE